MTDTLRTRLHPWRHWALLPVTVMFIALAMHMFWRAYNGSTHSWVFGGIQLAAAGWFITRGERARRRHARPRGEAG